MEPFGLTQDPFGRRSRLDLTAASRTLGKTYRGLRRSLAADRGAIVLAGPPGSGKTLLLRKLQATAGGNRKRFVPLKHGWLDTEQRCAPLRAALTQASWSRLSNEPTLLSISHFLKGAQAAGRKIILVVDNGHFLTLDQLARLFSLNLTSVLGRRPCRLLLAGSPQLLTLVERLDPQLEALQADLCYHWLEPLPAGDACQYVSRLLEQAGAAGRPIFEPHALRTVATVSGGNLRKLNQLAQRAMEIARQRRLSRIDRSAVLNAAAELQLGGKTGAAGPLKLPGPGISPAAAPPPSALPSPTSVTPTTPTPAARQSLAPMPTPRGRSPTRRHGWRIAAITAGLTGAVGVGAVTAYRLLPDRVPVAKPALAVKPAPSVTPHAALPRVTTKPAAPSAAPMPVSKTDTIAKPAAARPAQPGGNARPTVRVKPTPPDTAVARQTPPRPVLPTPTPTPTPILSGPQAETAAVTDRGLSLSKPEPVDPRPTASPGNAAVAESQPLAMPDPFPLVALKVVPAPRNTDTPSDRTPADKPPAEPAPANRRDTATTAAPAGSPQILQLQRKLGQLGFAPGPLDGVWGRRTATAVANFQARAGLPINPRAGVDRLLKQLQQVLAERR